jgi:hypothetical protein
VFSSKGDRPLQDMLGGGDLDGDEVNGELLNYLVIKHYITQTIFSILPISTL